MKIWVFSFRVQPSQDYGPADVVRQSLVIVATSRSEAEGLIPDCFNGELIEVKDFEIKSGLIILA